MRKDLFPELIFNLKCLESVKEGGEEGLNNLKGKLFFQETFFSLPLSATNPKVIVPNPLLKGFPLPNFHR